MLWTSLFLYSHAVSFNRALDVCKLTGAVLFSVGGTSVAVGLLLSAFARSYSKEELYLQQKFKERLADLHATVGKENSPTLFYFIFFATQCHLNDSFRLLSCQWWYTSTLLAVTALVPGSPIMRAPAPGEGKVPVSLSKVQNIQPVTTKSETWLVSRWKHEVKFG